jgi:hypothetical protein
MENIKRDFRLYQYNSGQLQKVGRGKTGPRPHLFEDYDACSNFIDLLRDKYKGYKETQFVIVEYFGAYNSRIVRVLDC